MSIIKCYRVLGVSPGASLRQVHRAYKKLVLRHHPDRTAGNPDSLAVFVEATEAYATLKRAFALKEVSRGAGPCPKCERFAPLLRAIDGRQYCAECILARRRRFLPLPTYEQIKFLGVLALQGTALWLLVMSVAQESMYHAAAAFLLLLGAWGLLVYGLWAADVIER